MPNRFKQAHHTSKFVFAKTGVTIDFYAATVEADAGVFSAK
ncbi:hypothetical protein PTE_01845 [Photorhabdus khanii NC19]|uniref:Uncharacterized protein n=1 Tax=Photorhabdus khanii NC19 TaxID=1004151 RepID=W3V8E0_9GAMM|nr:hypothetical protein PTE_01845 [Photorhabdus khanii NC19]